MSRLPCLGLQKKKDPNFGMDVQPEERHFKQRFSKLHLTCCSERSPITKIKKMTFVFGLVGFSLPHWIPATHKGTAQGHDLAEGC